MNASTSTHSTVNRMNGRNRIVGTKSAAAKPNAAKVATATTGHSSPVIASCGAASANLTTPVHTAADAPHTRATAWYLAAKPRPWVMKMPTTSPATTSASHAHGRPGVKTPHTAAGSTIDTPTHSPTWTALTNRAEAAIAAPRAVMSVNSLSCSSDSSSLTGATVSTGMPSRRANRSRPVIEPKCGGRTRATHSAISGVIRTSTSNPTSTQIASTCTEAGRNIRTAATAASTPHTVTTAVTTAVCHRLRAVTPIAMAPRITTTTPISACAAPSTPGGAQAPATASATTASQANPLNRSRRSRHPLRTTNVAISSSAPMPPATAAGIGPSVKVRARRHSPTTTATAIAITATAVCAAVSGVTGANIRSPPSRPSHLPMAANPLDSDSYCGSNDSPSTRGTSTRVSPSWTPSSSRLLLISSRTPLILCSS
ncbi:hypothetical protein PICSAR16_04518 [Mycobacterium avium subsp. paratuberculosis]|nr:hypothetical protein PICSAR16_04518 [Mycobacterium avium subsp. paratuberculosis]